MLAQKETLPKSTQTTRLMTYYATSRIKVIPNITTDYKITTSHNKISISSNYLNLISSYFVRQEETAAKTEYIIHLELV